MLKEKTGKRVELIVVLMAVFLFVLSGILLVVLSTKIFSISAGEGRARDVDLMNKLYIYGCSVITKHEDKRAEHHYITDAKCPFEIEFLEDVSYNDGTFNYYVSKVNEIRYGNRKEFTYKINGILLSIEATDAEYYRYVSYKNNTILYLSTMKPFTDNANEIRKNLGYEYSFHVHFEYVIAPVLVFVTAILLIAFPTIDYRIKLKGRKK